MDRAHSAAKIISLAVRTTGGRPVIFLGDIPPSSGELRVPTGHAAGFGYWLIDASVDDEDRAFLIEANPTNGAANSIIDGGVGRAVHMADSLLARVPDPVGGVAVLAHQDLFHHVPEFYSRVLIFAEFLEALGIPVVVVAAGESPDKGAFTILVDDIPRIAPFIDVASGGEMRYHGRPVVFMTNPNTLPALVRAGRCGSTRDIDLSVFHEGVLALLGQDKALQQDIAIGTGFTPLCHAEAGSLEDAAAAVLRMHAHGIAAVIKTHDTSGGTGVDVIKPGDDVLKRLRRLLSSAVERYGPGTERTVFPLRVFEFARSMLVPHRGGMHIWDCRIEVQVRPGEAVARPAQVRVCPAPFDAEFRREAVVSNVSGRPASTDFMLGPDELCDRLAPLEVRDRLLHAAATWAIRAEQWRANPAGAWRGAWAGCGCQPRIGPVRSGSEL